MFQVQNTSGCPWHSKPTQNNTQLLIQGGAHLKPCFKGFLLNSLPIFLHHAASLKTVGNWEVRAYKVELYAAYNY